MPMSNVTRLREISLMLRRIFGDVLLESATVGDPSAYDKTYIGDASGV